MHEEIRRITMNHTRRAALAVVIAALAGSTLAGVASAGQAGTQPGAAPDCPGCSAAASQATERTASDRDR